MWYSEKQSPTGSWYPQVTPEKPDEKLSDGTQVSLRYVAEISPEHENYNWGRLAALYGDGYITAETHPDIECVFVDGEPVQFAARAHLRDGWVEYLKTDDKGRFILTVLQTAVVTEMKHGKVTVNWR